MFLWSLIQFAKSSSICVYVSVCGVCIHVYVWCMGVYVCVCGVYVMCGVCTVCGMCRYIYMSVTCRSEWCVSMYVGCVCGMYVCDLWCVGGVSMCVSTQSCLTLCHPMDCSTPGSSVHGIFQARTLEWVTISFSSAYCVLSFNHQM